MLLQFLQLLGKAWKALTEATGTTTLGFILWGLGFTAVGWLASVFASWIDSKRQLEPLSFRGAVLKSRRLGLYLVEGIGTLVLLSFSVSVIWTIYQDHRDAVRVNQDLAARNKLLTANLGWHKHNLSTTDAVFPNLIYMLQAFRMFRNTLNGAPCVVLISASGESQSLASVFGQLSIQVSNCPTFGPMDPTTQGNEYPAMTDGMVPGKIVMHMERGDLAAMQLANGLGNQIPMTISYKLPPRGSYPAQTKSGHVHVVWLQFGPEVKWNSEMYPPR